MKNVARSLLLGATAAPLFTCLLCCLPVHRASGQVIVWGNTLYGNAGQTNVPSTATNVIELAAGDAHCLALISNGTVVAWGEDYAAQTNVPSDLTNAVSVAAGSTDSLALRSDGTVALWGDIFYGIDTVPPEATNVVALALGPGAQHAMVLRADGTVVDWANSTYEGTTNAPPTARNIVSVAAGSDSGVALRADGAVVAWGTNLFDATTVPATATNVVAIACGWYDTVALCADGSILTWGGSTALPSGPELTSHYGFTNIIDMACVFNELASPSLLGLRANGTLVQLPVNGATSIPANTTNVTAIAAGSYVALALIGNGPPVFPGMPVNRTVAGGKNAYFRMLATGALPMFYQWSCNGTNIPGATNTVLTLANVQPSLSGNDYSLSASNALGTASSGPMTLRVTSSEVYLQATTTSAVVDEAVTFSANTIGQGPFSFQWQLDGTNLTAATNADFTLTSAQLDEAGVYSVIASNTFGEVTNSVSLTVAPTIVTSAPQNQIVIPSGTATFSIGLEAIIPVSYQWQFDGTTLAGATSNSLTITNAQYDQAGSYSVIYKDSFETVTNVASLFVSPVAAWGDSSENSVPAGLTNLIAVASGFGYNFVLTADGATIGWAATSSGQATSPPGFSNVISIAAGNDGSVALKSDGTVVAWGNNSSGETNVPAGLSNVVAVAAGSGLHYLALESDGRVVAWGNNEYGQTNVPADLSNVVAIAAGEWSSMALRSDGTVAAWGAGTVNTGEDPDFGQSIVPANLSHVVRIATGGPDDLVLEANGSITGWGANFNGEDTPPPAISHVVAIAAGYGFSVALEADGTVTTWGDNSFSDVNTPTGLTNVVAISSEGNFHTLALIASVPPPIQAPILNPTWTQNGFAVSVPSQSGRVYAMSYKNSLTDGNWTALPLVAGTGGTLTLTDTTATNSQRFYLIQQW
jgi:alpha-tubulin suppressor-like RCC1 family protein